MRVNPGHAVLAHTLGGRAVAAFVVLAMAAGGLTASDSRLSNRSGQGPDAAAPRAPLACGLVAPQASTISTLPEYQAVVGQPATDGEVREAAQAAPTTVAYDGARLVIGAGATRVPVPIGITPLTADELPPLDVGMTNVTEGPRQGYRFTPQPFAFESEIEVVIPYDPERVGASFGAEDVHTYSFDDASGCWLPLERVRVDEEEHVVVSRANRLATMVNAVVTVPEHAETSSFNPTQIKDLEAANPGAGLTLVNAPGASNTGDAALSYPLVVPPGRGGMQPQLAVGYNSAGGNGWLGLGWDLPLPSITVDTRWGVPRYDGGLETETYLFGGEQLTPVAHRAALQARSAEKVFHTRVEGGFARIVRHGTSPKNYTWEVVDKSGGRFHFGGTATSTLTDDVGNGFQWALREVRDPHGNVMRYHSVRQDDAGVTDGSVPGRTLYLQKITYTGDADTEGPYAVTFVRDRELEEPRRPDVSIDARGGFKRVTADLLRRIEVTLDNLPIRQYEFDYTTGAFGKTLLRSVTEFDENGQRFAGHTFDYFDDIRDGSGAYRAFDRVTWESPDDGLGNDAVGAVRGGAGEAGALNSNTSTGAGGHLYVGAGPFRTKSGSVGVKTGFSSAEETGLLALVDVDGDNLPDKVFRGDDGMTYRKNLARPGGQPRFSAELTPLRNLPGIFRENSDTLTVGVESYLGVTAQLDHVDTFTTTDRYLADVNGDGIIDLVNGGGVLFGRIGPDGAPVYGASGDTPVPIGSLPVDASGLLADFTVDRERQTDSHPLVDTVRRWVAPFDGAVRISGDVRLVEETAPERAGYEGADGVRVAIQHEATELWSRQIGASDFGTHPPAGVDSIAVQRGDRLYFRVQSNADGAYDRVAWDPRIDYTEVPDSTDVNGLHPYRYQASRDFTLGGRATSVTVPTTGTVRLSGALTKRAATTDDVTALVTLDGRTVFEQTLPAGQVGDIAIDREVPVEQGQRLQWRVRVDSPIDLGQLAWSPRAEYASGQVIEAPYDVDMYPANSLTAPQGSYPVPADGTLLVAPTLTVDDPTLDSRLVFTVKTRGALLAKRVIEITDGQIPEQPPLTVPVSAGTELFLDFSTSDRQLAGKLTGQSVRVGYDEATLGTAPSALHSAAAEGAFAQPYRGWGVIGYNGNRDRAGQPIAQDALVVDESYRGQLPADVDPERDRDEFAADPRVAPPKVFPFSPAPAKARWEAGDHLWAAADATSSSRLGTTALTAPLAADFDDVTAVPRVSRSTQISVSGSVVGVGGSVASGDAVGELDYLDMNGDHFPDVVGAAGIMYTDPTGQLGANRSATPDGNVRKTGTTSANAGAGSAARTITTGRGYAAPPAHSSANTSTSGNDLPPLGIGGNLGAGESNGKFDLLDINGDALPDRVYADGRAALNLGYRFAAPEPWPGGALHDGTTRNGGVNIGFSTDFYGFAGGASFNEGRSSTESSLLDVNGDGLTDRVFEGDPIRVALNTGAGFAPAAPFAGSLPGVNTDVNAKLGAGGYVTFSACVGLIFGCVVTNPGADTSVGVSRSEQALRDIDGDGFVDHLRSTSDNELVVARNQTGRTNLLRQVKRPLGARIDLDYTRDGNTYDQPNSKFVLSRVALHDGQAGDGQDTQLTTFRYSGGSYDRLEREFRGYGSVVEEHRDPGAADAVYRSITREFRTDSHYTRGLVSRELTTDAAGRPFQETTSAYQLRDVTNPGRVADPASTTATIFPQLVRTDQRFHEGQDAPGKTTYQEMSYDEVGNLTRTLDAAEAGPGDDVETKIRYTAEDAACRASGIVDTAKTEDVRGNGVLMRHRESTVDCGTGNVTQHRARLADGATAVTDLGYFADGNLKSVTNPSNAKGQRYRIDYEYDPATTTHVTATRDSFGLRSTSTYNLRHGLVETFTDVNNQRIRYYYDAVGRIDAVVGAHETAENHPTIDFEYHPEATVPYAVTRHIDRNSDGSIKTDSIDTITFTDGLARVTQVKKDAAVSTGPDIPVANVMTVSGRTVYDFLGRAVEQYYPTTELKGPLNNRFRSTFDSVRPTRTSFDVLDRATRTVLPDQTVTSTAYGFGPDRAGSTQFEVAATDANGNTTRTYTDVRRLTVGVMEANPAGGQPVIWTSYGYDALGQLTRLVDDQDNVTTSAYDHFGRRTVVDNPDTGRTQTVYDLADNPVKEITANLAERHKAIEYEYDFDRLAAIRYPVFDGNDVTYRYGAPGAPNNGAGRVVEVRDAAGTVEREYGPLGEVTKETRTVAEGVDRDVRYTTQYRYDTWNRMLQLTYPDGEVLSYHYNSGGLVDGATGVKGGRTYPYLTRLDYDKFEQRALLETGNGTRTRFTYDAEDRRLATLASSLRTGVEFQHTDYAYDNVGNVTGIESGTDDRTGRQTFAYDSLHRLTGSQGEYRAAADGPTDRYQVSMSYDSIDNVTLKDQRHEIVGSTPVVQPATTYRYPYEFKGAQPHAPTDLGPYDLKYDANGNQISRTDRDNRRQMVWDEENRLVCVRDKADRDHLLTEDESSCPSDSDVRFVYDDQGTRVVKDAGRGNVSIYPNEAYSQRKQTSYKHVFVGGTRLVSKVVEPERYVEANQFYYHQDHLESTSYGTNADGQVVEHLRYFPGGETWVDESAGAPTPYQFSGKELDQETGLYYYGARYYDPRTAVWQNPDPAMGDYLPDAGNPGAKLPGEGGVFNSRNLGAYGYAHQNPVTNRDPDGALVETPRGLQVVIPPGPDTGTSTGTSPKPPPGGGRLKGPGPIGVLMLLIQLLNKPVDMEVPELLPMPEPVTESGTKPVRDDKGNRLVYVTYTKFNYKTQQVYVGRSSGYGHPLLVAAARSSGHEYNKRGFGTAILDKWAYATLPWHLRRSDPAYRAIRGREQQYMDHHGGPRSDRRQTMSPPWTSGNDIRAVRKNHELGRKFHDAATAKWGEYAPYTGN
ncbi:SpvB/TcaC N-terminal domain-containing protein [Micromonospora sp. NPDC050397]|uniref:SpvB/TcaC N-terminal domain-containing protein n=1 Tax=Micromonospora sp. NPDC050397 TaxID=3364279 RepID=UPI00384DE453